jgi:two-component system chemotaxis response regulator CheB
VGIFIFSGWNQSLHGVAKMRDIVVIGASAGGVEAIKEIATNLSPKIDAAIFVVVHVSPNSSGLLPNILNRSSVVPAHQAVDGERIENGHIYVAPPDHHMLLEEDIVRVVRGPRHNRQRPAIDLLFRTAAKTFGDRVIGVVLTGFLDDGSSGLLAVKNGGGLAIVQNPEDAEVESMPRSALQRVNADFCVSLKEVAPLINQLVKTEVLKMAHAGGNNNRKASDKTQTNTSFTCPDCHGNLWEVSENGEIRFECRVGHAYSPVAMMEANDEDVERSLWVALRALEESAALEQRLADLANERQRASAMKLFADKAHDRKQHAATLREFLTGSKRRMTEAEGEEGKEELENVS